VVVFEVVFFVIVVLVVLWVVHGMSKNSGVVGKLSFRELEDDCDTAEFGLGAWDDFSALVVGPSSCRSCSSRLIALVSVSSAVVLAVVAVTVAAAVAVAVIGGVAANRSSNKLERIIALMVVGGGERGIVT